MVTIEPSTIHVFDMTVEPCAIDERAKIEVGMEDVAHTYDDLDNDIIHLRFKFTIETMVPADGFQLYGYMERTYKICPKSGMTATDLHKCVMDGGKKLQEMVIALYGKTKKPPTVDLEIFDDDFFPNVLEEILNGQ